MNIIPTAYRVLFLLQLFIQHKHITYQQFKQAMEALPSTITKNTAETEPLSISAFRKYVKTLQFLGCDIITINQNNKRYLDSINQEKTQSYVLKTHPFAWQPSNTDWLLFLQFYLQLQPSQRPLLSQLLWNLSPSLTQQLTTTFPLEAFNTPETQLPLELSIPSFLLGAFPESVQTTIQMLEAILATDNGVLLWLYPEAPSKTPLPLETQVFPPLPTTPTPLLSGFPKQLTLQDKGIVQLRLEDVCSHQQYLIPVSKIHQLCTIPASQLHSLISDTEPSVQFMVKGALVHAYEKQENETIIDTHINPETNAVEALVIETTNVDIPKLFQRLKRYGTLATLLKPQHLRQRFIQQLKQQQLLVCTPN